MDDHSVTTICDDPQKTPVLVIETGTFHRNVIRRNYGQLVTGSCQIPCVFKMLGLKTTVNSWLKHMWQSSQS